MTGHLVKAPWLRDSLVCRLAGVLSAHWRNVIKCPDFPGWRHLFQTAVHLGGIRTTFEFAYGSPMLIYLDLFHLDYGPPCITDQCSWSQFSSQRLTHKLRSWVREVLYAGQDLQEYGRWEREWLSAHGERFLPAGIRTVAVPCHVVNFTSGPNPEDWEIWATLSTEECVGDFWEGLENPDLEIPGSWPDPWMTSGNNHDTQDFRNHVSWFRLSRRRRRRLVRYWGLTREQYHKYWNKSRRENNAREMEEEKVRKKRQKQFFKEAGIIPLSNRWY